jgi:tetratricopeptide (TPR) repeat protein
MIGGNFSMATPPEDAPTVSSDHALESYLRREPTVLAMLSVLVVVGFLAVTGLSRLYFAQQQSLGNRWFERGAADLKAQNFNQAVLEFRTALRYSRDNYDYQLHLAEALNGENRINEAQAYLINLWERQPEDGFVNLELARIAAERGETEHALGYYHNAIYATWPSDQEVERRETRIELIEYLLKIKARPQAESELIALAANLGNEPEQQTRLGNLFLQAEDYQHALDAFGASLKADRHDTVALRGAGEAAFELGQYPLASHYLEAAVEANPNDAGSAGRLKLTELVEQMDPLQHPASAAERARIVMTDFAVAGERLKLCGNQSGLAASAQQNLAESWTTMKPKITSWNLSRSPDVAESAMALVFNIERQTASCGAAVEPDQALLLIARLHAGS